MGVSHYRPGPQFVGLFPFYDFVFELTKQLTAITLGVSGSFAPKSTPNLRSKWGVPDLVNQSVKNCMGAAGLAKDCTDIVKPNTYGAQVHKSKVKNYNKNLLAITWSYLPGKGMIKISSNGKPVTFAAMYSTIENEINKLYGV